MSFWGLPHWLNENSPICDIHAVRPSVIRGEGFLVWENVNIGYPLPCASFHQAIPEGNLGSVYKGNGSVLFVGVLGYLLISCSLISHYNTGYLYILSAKNLGFLHDDLVSVVLGSLLGHAYAEKRPLATRIQFKHESGNMEHLIHTWQILKEEGYCSGLYPKIQERLGHNGKKRFVCRFKTFTHYSFNWFYDTFYHNVNGVNIKKVPIAIEEFLSPIALAFWIMDNGTKHGEGLRISANSFTKEDVLRLCHALKKKYDIESTPVISGYGKHSGLVKYALYIKVNSMDKLRLIVKPFFLKSMLYKLGL
jgi:hypothetical protein